MDSKLSFEGNKLRAWLMSYAHGASNAAELSFTIVLLGGSGHGKRRLVFEAAHSASKEMPVEEIPAVCFESGAWFEQILGCSPRRRGVWLISRLDDILGDRQFHAQRRLATFLRLATQPQHYGRAQSARPVVLTAQVAELGVSALLAQNREPGDERARSRAAEAATLEHLFEVGVAKDLGAMLQHHIWIPPPSKNALKWGLTLGSETGEAEFGVLKAFSARCGFHGIISVKFSQSAIEKLVDDAVAIGAGYHGLRCAVMRCADLLSIITMRRAVARGETELLVTTAFPLSGYTFVFMAPLLRDEEGPDAPS